MNSLTITDENVFKYWGEEIKEEKLILSPGENIKSIEGYLKCLECLSFLPNVDKIIGFGGGTVLDLAGFVASTWKRGICYNRIPTTLLGMVDASIGEKCGINLYGKNMVGSYIENCELPNFNEKYLSTLPQSEIQNGLVEMVKAGILVGALVSLDYSHKQITRSRAIKSNLLSQRDYLNYGHTIGHCLEVVSGYKVPHGEAVFWGMIVANNLSGRCDINRYLKGMFSFSKNDFKFEQILKYLKYDKKGYLKFVVIDSPFEPKIAEFKLKQIEEAYNGL